MRWGNLFAGMLGLAFGAFSILHGFRLTWLGFCLTAGEVDKLTGLAPPEPEHG